MANTVSPQSTLASTGSKMHGISRSRAFMMDFNVIITFRMSIETLKAVDSVTDVHASGWQIIFDYRIAIRSTSTYDSLMRRLRQAVLNEVKAICGLDEADVTMISTSADWTLWEQITGLDHQAEAAKSNVTKNGKFYFPAFDQQVEDSKRSGKSLADLSDGMTLAFYERK